MTSRDEMASIEKSLRSLVRGEFSSLTISFNDDHACNYANAQRWSDEWGFYNDLDEWVSAEERERALRENSVWSAQWYPDTPVGFHILRASSLPALLSALIQKDTSHVGS